MKEILLATNNKGKVERFTKLIGTFAHDIVLRTPRELNIDVNDVEENGTTLAENAELKVRAYFGKTNLPILANDTGFWLDDEGLVDAPKRTALQGLSEEELSDEEVAEKLISFWKNKARETGGKRNAAWEEDFALLLPNGDMHHAQSRREIILTDQEFGTPHIQMPVRALYISKATNKPAVQHSEEEEVLELQPIVQALRELVGHVS